MPSHAPATPPPPLAGGRLFGEVFRTAPKKRTATLLVLAVGGTALVHGLVWGIGRMVEPSHETWSSAVAARVHAELMREAELDLSPLPKPAPALAKVEPAPPPEAKEEEPEPAPSAPRAKAERATPPPEAAKATPPAAPAEAAKALTAEGPVDLGDQVIIEGKGDLYAGGATHADGKSKVAVTAKNVDPRAEPGGKGEPGGGRADGGAGADVAAPPVAAAEPEVDRSAPARIRDPEWQCPWPQAADDERIDTQAVIVRVTVGASGSFEGARLVRDPGRGFGAAALACTKTARYQAAKDAWGKPVTSTSAIRITFTR